MDNKNLLNIISAANDEDASEVMNLVGSEIAARIHQELEAKKVELANDLLTEIQIDEGKRLRKIGKHLKKHKGKYALGALGIAGATLGGKKALSKRRSSQSYDGNAFDGLTNAGRAAFMAQANPPESTSAPKPKKKKKSSVDYSDSNAVQTALGDPDHVWKI